MKKKLKLSTKLAVGIVSVSLLGLLILFMIINTYIRGHIEEQVRDGYYNRNTIMANEVDYWLRYIANLVNGMGFAVHQLPKESMYCVTESFEYFNDYIAIAFVGFPDGHAIASHGMSPEPGWYSFERPWYIDAIVNPGQTVISTPYWSLTEEAWVTSASRFFSEVYEAGAVAAVLVTLDSMLEIISMFEIDGGYVFLITSDGDAISHPHNYSPTDRLFNIGDSPTYSDVLTLILAGGDFIPFINRDGIESYIITMQMGLADWVLVSVVPAQAIDGVVNRLTSIVMITVLSAFAVLIVFIFIAVSRLLNNSIGGMISGFQDSSMALARGEGLQFSNDRDNSFGLDKMNREFENNLTVIHNILQDIDRLSNEFIQQGDIEYRIDTSKYSGAYKELMQKTNGLVQSSVDDISPLLQALSQLADGDFDITVKELPGKKSVMHETLRSIVAKLSELDRSIFHLAKSASEGDLTVHIDTSIFSGNWAKVARQLNSLMDAIAKPLADIQHNIAIMSEGDFSHLEGEYPGTFGVLQNACNNVNDITEALIKDISETLGAIAKGDLTVRLKENYVGSYAPIETSLNTILDDLNSTLSEIKDAVAYVTEGAGLVSTSSITLAEATMKQTASIHELRSSAALIQEKATIANKDAIIASESGERIQKNIAVGDIAVKSMESTMKKVKDSSEDIRKIIDVISNIAFQTNLLALNASVEAARAGEHGMGFSVVADEVRSLASRSQNSTTETSRIIEEDLTHVNDGLQATKAVVDSFGTIEGDITEISGHITEIAEITKEQLKSISDINTSVSEINEAIADISAFAEESAAASQELNAKADLLNEKIAFFKLRSY